MDCRDEEDHGGVTFDLKHLPAYSPNLNLIERFVGEVLAEGSFLQ